jgi:hypothetical protein
MKTWQAQFFPEVGARANACTARGAPGAGRGSCGGPWAAPWRCCIAHGSSAPARPASRQLGVRMCSCSCAPATPHRLRLTLPPPLLLQMLETHEGSQYCGYTNTLLNLFTSSLFLAGAASALVGSWTTKHWGRRTTMILGGIFFFAGAIIQAASVHVAMIIVGRVVLGVGLALNNQSVPLYLSEMAPHKLRGALNVLFQLA